MKKPVVVVGGGGHAKVLIDVLLLRRVAILGFVDPAKKELVVCGRKIKYLGDDNFLLKESGTKEFMIANAIGSIGDTRPRREIFEKFKRRHFDFLTVIHPSAVVSRGARLGEGVQVMAGAVVQVAARIGENSIVNTGATVDHDCQIGSHVHIAPGVVLSGGVTVGEGSHIGTGATVRQGLVLGKNVFVNMKNVVIENLGDGRVMTGKIGGPPVREEQ